MRAFHHSVFLCLLMSLLIVSCGEQEKEITVQSIAISQPSAEIKVGETLTLKATVSPSNASYDGLNWTSTNPNVASVSASGLVTALSEGNTIITVMAGGKTASCSITVVKGFVAVTSINLNKASLELVEGDSESLTATVLPDDATDKTVTWASSNEGVATVKDGTVTAITEGETTVSAKAGNQTASCKVIVKKKIIAVVSIELNKTEITLVEGDSESLTATVKPSNATNKNVSWSSSDDAVATVKDGVVTSVKEGTATITVTTEDGGRTASCEITVTPQIYHVTSVSLDKTECVLLEGEQDTLRATVEPENANNKNIFWSSENETVATVKDGVVTAISEGVVTIAVTAEDGGVSATCEVTVKKEKDIYLFLSNQAYKNWNSFSAISTDGRQLSTIIPHPMFASNGHVYCLDVKSGTSNDSVWKDYVAEPFPKGFLARCIFVDNEDVYVGGCYNSKAAIVKNGSIWKELGTDYGESSSIVTSLSYYNGHVYSLGTLTFDEEQMNKEVLVEWYDEECIILSDTRKFRYTRYDKTCFIDVSYGTRILTWYESQGGANQIIHLMIGSNDIKIPNGEGRVAMSVEGDSIYVGGHYIDPKLHIKIPMLWVYDRVSCTLKFSIKLNQIYGGATSVYSIDVQDVFALDGKVYICGTEQATTTALYWEVEGEKVVDLKRWVDSARFVYVVDNRK